MKPRSNQQTGGKPPDNEVGLLRRRLHDTTLQTLEYIAQAGALGAGADLERGMRLAAREATDLRYLLEGVVGDDPKSLPQTLRCVVAGAAAVAHHRIELALRPMGGPPQRPSPLQPGGAAPRARPT